MDNVYVIEIKKTIDKQKVVFSFLCPIRSCTATNKSFQRIFPHEERSLKSPTQVVNQSTRSGNSFIEQLLENWQTMEIGVWGFLQYCGIGRPKRSASTRENQSSFGLSLSSKSSELGCTYRYWHFCCKSDGNWKFTCKYFNTRVSVGNTTVLISKIDIFAASLMATVLGDRYSSCSNYNFLCSSSDGNCSRGHLPRYYSLLPYKLNADR